MEGGSCYYESGRISKVMEVGAFRVSSVHVSSLSSGSFLSDVVHIYYISDETVQKDVEIQAFIKDVCSFGMQDFDHCGECERYTARLFAQFSS